MDRTERGAQREDRAMRNIGIVAFATLFLLLGIRLPASAKVVDRVVAVVNYEILTQGDLERLISEQAQALRVYEGRSLDEALKIARAQAKGHLDELIAQTLLEQEARRQAQKDPTLQVTQLMLDEEISQFRIQQDLLDETKFRQALDAQGYTMATFRRDMLRRVRIQELLKREVVPRLNVTDAEVSAFYDAHRDQFQDKSQAKMALREQRFTEERDRYIQSLRDKSFVKILVQF